jgi:hypothetical protein
MEDDFMGRDWSTSPTTNVTGTNVCDEVPWAHLLEGRGINTTTGLVGAFGRTGIGFHAELLCLMNGTHENGKYYGAADDGSCQPDSCTLRVEDRMCNHCREITAYQVFRRSSLLDEHSEWVSSYRAAFYERFGFKAPELVPQSNDRRNPEEGTQIYEACVSTQASPEQTLELEKQAEIEEPHYEGCVLVEP